MDKLTKKELLELLAKCNGTKTEKKAEPQKKTEKKIEKPTEELSKTIKLSKKQKDVLVDKVSSQVEMPRESFKPVEPRQTVRLAPMSSLPFNISLSSTKKQELPKKVIEEKEEEVEEPKKMVKRVVTTVDTEEEKPMKPPKMKSVKKEEDVNIRPSYPIRIIKDLVRNCEMIDKDKMNSIKSKKALINYIRSVGCPAINLIEGY